MRVSQGAIDEIRTRAGTYTFTHALYRLSFFYPHCFTPHICIGTYLDMLRLQSELYFFEPELILMFEVGKVSIMFQM